jgi:2-phosphosulfolactate phosphatase
MKNIIVNTYQGNNDLEYSDINIVIDVIRAFTVSHHAFLNGVKEIILTNNEEEALFLKRKNNEFILSGEVNGIKINSFEFGNSPYDLSSVNLNEKTLIQKTTNGVKVAISSLDTDNLFVTGYSNAFTTASYVKELLNTINKDTIVINIIASHPTGDDDFACAHYLKNIILDNVNELKDLEESIVYRIVNSDAAKKFYDIKNKDFSILDILLCSVQVKSNFVMQVKNDKNRIVISKKN